MYSYKSAEHFQKHFTNIVITWKQLNLTSVKITGTTEINRNNLFFDEFRFYKLRPYKNHLVCIIVPHFRRNMPKDSCLSLILVNILKSTAWIFDWGISLQKALNNSKSCNRSYLWLQDSLFIAFLPIRAFF